MKSRGTLEYPRSLGPHLLATDRPVKKGLAPKFGRVSLRMSVERDKTEDLSLQTG